MQKLGLLLATITLLSPLACGSAGDEPEEHPLTLEPEKTRALLAGVSGVWEVSFPDGTGVGTRVGRLELCEDTTASDEDREYRMRSSETAPRQITTNDGQGGGGGMGCSSYVHERDVVALWRGTWTTNDGGFEMTVVYRTREELYPASYPLSFSVQEKQGIGPSGVGSFELGAGLRLSPKLVRLPDGRPDLVFRRIGDARCTNPQAVDAGR